MPEDAQYQCSMLANSVLRKGVWAHTTDVFQENEQLYISFSFSDHDLALENCGIRYISIVPTCLQECQGVWKQKGLAST